MSEAAFSLEAADVPYEEDVRKNAFVLKSWLRYLAHKSTATPAARYSIYERALAKLPGSYKLWAAYLRERRAAARARPLTSRAWTRATAVHERALRHLAVMPRLWLDYTAFLRAQKRVTATREAFDRALRSLPVTQHERIWQEYVSFARESGLASLALRVQRRYLKLNRAALDDVVTHMRDAGRFDAAAQLLVRALDGEYGACRGKLRSERFALLVELCSKHAKKVRSVRLEPVVRSALRGAGASGADGDAARLWLALADHHIRLGNFARARDTFEEALASVAAVRDFSQLWDAYTRFEDELLAATAEAAEAADDGDAAAAELELSVARYERLVERQPFLLNAVLLRQDPHNVHEWHKRVALHRAKGDWAAALRAYDEALATVDSRKADGKLPSLWLALAAAHEARGDLDAARETLARARRSPARDSFATVDELAAIWCAAAEFELRHDETGEAARDVLRDALESQQPVPIAKSLKLWSFRADVEECFGESMDNVCAVYDEMLRRKVATPQTVLCYAAMLEEKRHWERAFRAYERGVAAFSFPFSRDIWATYLERFVARYGGRKLERARDLFEQVLEAVPPADSTLFYVMYAKLEETHGLARHAMAIYRRAAHAVPDADRARMYLLYVARAAERFGVAKTRDIYEEAIDALPDQAALAFARRYAALECRLGEVDRARAIFTHAAQLAEPRSAARFWAKWHEFEVKYGSEDTFAEMLRVKRTVEALHATGVNVAVLDMASSASRQQGQTTDGAGNLGHIDAMEQVEREAAAAKEIEQIENEQWLAQREAEIAAKRARLAGDDDDDDDDDANGDDEFDEDADVDDKLMMNRNGADDADDDDDNGNIAVVTKAVPDSVFVNTGAAGAREKLLAKRKRAEQQ